MSVSTLYWIPPEPTPSDDADQETVLELPTVKAGSTDMTGVVGAVLSLRVQVRTDQALCWPRASLALARK